MMIKGILVESVSWNIEYWLDGSWSKVEIVVKIIEHTRW